MTFFLRSLLYLACCCLFLEASLRQSMYRRVTVSEATMLNGKEELGLPAVTALVCGIHCHGHLGCNAFTYDTALSHCVLLSGFWLAERDVLDEGGQLVHVKLAEDQSLTFLKVFLRRIQGSGNPNTYFTKSPQDYQDGFAAGGEEWLGLHRLHFLTSAREYSLRVVLTDWDDKQHTAIYNKITVGGGPGFPLSLSAYDSAQSTLSDALTERSNGKNFTGGSRWWCVDNSISCFRARLTGDNSATRHPTLAESAIPENNNQNLIVWKTGNNDGTGQTAEDGKNRAGVHYNSYANWKAAMMGLEPIFT